MPYYTSAMVFVIDEFTFVSRLSECLKIPFPHLREFLNSRLYAEPFGFIRVPSPSAWPPLKSS